MAKDFVEEVYCGTRQGSVTRYNFSVKYRDAKGLKIFPQVLVTIQQGRRKVRLEGMQVKGLEEMVKERQEKLDDKHIRNSAS